MFFYISLAQPKNRCYRASVMFGGALDRLCCSVLLWVAVCCSVYRCVAVCCGVLHCVAVCRSVLQHACSIQIHTLISTLIRKAISSAHFSTYNKILWYVPLVHINPVIFWPLKWPLKVFRSMVLFRSEHTTPHTYSMASASVAISESTNFLIPRTL